MADKYRRVEKAKKERDETINENEIRVTFQGRIRQYLNYATTVFKEKNGTEVVLKAMGRAINKAVTVAEILKQNIPGLHQITNIDSTEIIDIFEPLEEGLDRVETTRHLSSISIHLSTVPLDTKALGYQPPLSPEQMKPYKRGRNNRRRRPRYDNRNTPGSVESEQRTRGRGSRQRTSNYSDVERERSTRGRGRGRGNLRNREPREPRENREPREDRREFREDRREFRNDRRREPREDRREPREDRREPREDRREPREDRREERREPRLEGRELRRGRGRGNFRSVLRTTQPQQ